MVKYSRKKESARPSSKPHSGRRYYNSLSEALAVSMLYALKWAAILWGGACILFYMIFVVIKGEGNVGQILSSTWPLAILGFLSASLLKLADTYGKQKSLERRLLKFLPSGAIVKGGEIYYSKKDPTLSGYRWILAYDGYDYRFTNLNDWLHIGIGKYHFAAKVGFVKVNDAARASVLKAMRDITSLVG